MLVEERVKDAISSLRIIKDKIDELNLMKERLVDELNILVNHKPAGSKTYQFGNTKFTLTSGYNYCLDKSRYEEVVAIAPELCTFVKPVVKYDLDVKKIEALEASQYVADRKILAMMITKKPKKLYIKLHEEKPIDSEFEDLKSILTELDNNGELF